MQEIFYEESAVVQNEKSATRKYNILKTLSVISYVFMVIWIIFAFNFFPLDNFNFVVFLIEVLIPVAMFCASGILLGRMKNKTYVDYDYTFVTGSVRVSKVIKQIKRKGVISFNTSQILQLGKYGSASCEKLEKTPDVKTLILTSNVSPAEGKDFYYLYVNDVTNKLLIFECTETFMANVLRYSNKMILEKDFK